MSEETTLNTWLVQLVLDLGSKLGLIVGPSKSKTPTITGSSPDFKVSWVIEFQVDEGRVQRKVVRNVGQDIEHALTWIDGEYESWFAETIGIYALKCGVITSPEEWDEDKSRFAIPLIVPLLDDSVPYPRATSQAMAKVGPL